MSKEIKYYTDEHVDLAVAQGLRLRGVDVLTTQEAGMRGATDPEHLALATSQGRVIVTRDNDFVRLHASGISHAGIAYMPKPMSIGEIIDGLMLIYHATDSDYMQNNVEYL